MQTRSKILTAVLLAMGSAVAMAQTGPVRPQYQFPGGGSPGGPGAMQMGDSAWYASPFITGSFGYDDNLFATPSNQEESWVMMLRGGVTVEARDPNKVIMLSYVGTAARYTSSRPDDYQDQTFRASFDMLATRQAAFRLGYEYLRGHDARGSTDRPDAATPDEYKASTPSVLFSYGQADARGRVEAWYSTSDKRYLNNRVFTAGSDRDTDDAGVAGYFRVAPKTQILAEYRRTELDYKLAISPLDGTEERIYGGVTWEATAATTGTVKVGQLKKEFDRTLPSFSGTGWEAIISWSPRTYSKFDIYSTRTPIESTGEGSFILSDATGVTWTHGWSELFTTDVSARYQKDKYQSNPRKDEVTSFGIGAKYQMRRWLQFGAQYQFMNRDSNTPLNDYDRNMWFITATATM